MTHHETLDIIGPVKITIKGPQGSGKSQLSKAIADHLKKLGIETVCYDSETPVKKRLWRRPYSEPAKVMIVEKQGEVI